MAMVLWIVFVVVASGLMLAGIWMFCRDVSEGLFCMDDFMESDGADETADDGETMQTEGDGKE